MLSQCLGMLTGVEKKHTRTYKTDYTLIEAFSTTLFFSHESISEVGVEDAGHGSLAFQHP